MALYKHGNFLSLLDVGAFDKLTGPGHPTPYSGVYRCAGCGREIISEQGNPMPPQNHHEHEPYEGAIRWQLIVAANHERAA